MNVGQIKENKTKSRKGDFERGKILYGPPSAMRKRTTRAQAKVKGVCEETHRGQTPYIPTKKYHSDT